MSYITVTIHAVWGTKRRRPFLSNGIRQLVINHIFENAKNKGISILALDGYYDHLHCLFRLNAELSTAKAVQLMKGESSYWINKEKLTKFKFGWADEYYAASVSEDLIPVIINYINNQENHHRKKTLEVGFLESLNKSLRENYQRG